MNANRRQLLKAALAAGGALGLGASSPVLRTSSTRPLKLLILGGTSFLGPHQVRYALERGHQVTIFTRGQTRPTVFPEAFERVEQLIGDRQDDLRALHGREWDAVIDNSGRRVEWARDSAQLLKDAVRTYLYTSSTGVYYPYLTREIDEEREVHLVDESEGADGSAAYGVMKALSEGEVRAALGERALVVRPGYIVGPANCTGRFTYWVERLQRGGEVLVPGKRDDRVQLIDVRDLAEWMIHLVEDAAGGVFNATGPASPLTMAEFVHGMRATGSAPLSWTWIEDYEFLVEQRLTYAIPWLMQDGPELGSLSIDVSRALARGLTHRPLAVTALETLAWWRSEAVSPERRANPRFALTPEREARILAAWKAR